MPIEDGTGAYERGRAFLVEGGVPGGCVVPILGEDLPGWMCGYVAALTEDDPDGACVSIEAALRADGIEGKRLDQRLRVAEDLERSGDADREFCRWPALPVRTSAEAVAARDARLGELGERIRPAGLIGREMACRVAESRRELTPPARPSQKAG
jgi:hypothetical protein